MADDNFYRRLGDRAKAGKKREAEDARTPEQRASEWRKYLNTGRDQMAGQLKEFIEHSTEFIEHNDAALSAERRAGPPNAQWIAKTNDDVRVQNTKGEVLKTYPVTKGQRVRVWQSAPGEAETWVEVGIDDPPDPHLDQDPDDLFSVGRIFYYGEDRPQDYELALECFESAANRGHLLAQEMLGMIYLRGEGAEQDFNEAAQWHRRAADQGHQYSQEILGIFCQDGIGVEKNAAEAADWYRKAAAQGLESAQERLDQLPEQRDTKPDLSGLKDEDFD